MGNKTGSKKISQKIRGEKKIITPLNTDTGDLEKELDPEIIVGDPIAVDEDAAELATSADDAIFDEEELNPFGDKWEQ